jgi:hypothetical protein
MVPPETPGTTSAIPMAIPLSAIAIEFIDLMVKQSPEKVKN